MRRGLLTCLVLLTLCATGVACAARANSRTPAPPATAAPGDIGVTPTAPLNPSDPPGGAPIATGFRLGASALLLWFSRAGSPIGLDSAWYDTDTGQPVDGPQYTMGWVPSESVSTCFQQIGEMTLPDGDLLDVGWLIGPASAVVMTQHTVSASAAIAQWAPDPRKVAFWIRRHGRPLTAQDTTPTPDTPIFTAIDEHGKTVCRQAFTSPDMHPNVG
jgi:hypothetical protein